MIYVIGTKGGVGTTTVAVELARAGSAVAVDLADGQFAARVERTTWPLAALAFVVATTRRARIEEIVQRRHTLLWSAECALAPDNTWSIIYDIAHRRPVVIDGGLAPVAAVVRQAEQYVIVTADNDVARWHERQLLQQMPRALVVFGLKEAARVLAAQLFPSS